MEMQMVKELLLQALEHEMGGTKIYQTALKCVVNEDLKEEWEKYLEETEKHVQVLHDACLQLEIDPTTRALRLSRRWKPRSAAATRKWRNASPRKPWSLPRPSITSTGS